MHLPTFKEMLGALVGTPSVSCTCPDVDQSNLGVIAHLGTWLEGLGFDVEEAVVPGRPGKGNLIARLGSGPGGLVLSGHTDTVPCDADQWSSSPFALNDCDDRYYGLGTCDMKGFFPIALEAARHYANARLGAPLTIVATADEESTMAGGRLLAESGAPRAAWAVIGEPTGLVPVYAHKGMAMLSIALKGASGHSSNPDLGRNALDAMHAVMGELIAYRTELAARWRNPGFAVQIPTLNLGCLRGGDNPNRICDHAELQIDLRLLPGMDSQATIAILEERVCAAAATHGIAARIEPFYPPLPPFETDPEGELVRTLAEASGRAPGTVAFGTEGPFLQSLGMETVIFGPGSIDQAHQPDEYLAHTQIEPATRVLRTLIERCCAPT
jgi:acetylornithine deacetylase